MATISGSRRSKTLEDRSGGKMVRERRPAGPRTPYERPSLAESDARNPNLISKLILSPTRAIATGAGKLLSLVFSQDDSDSDTDTDTDTDSDPLSESESEGNVESDHDEDDLLSKRAALSNEKNQTSEMINYFRKDPEPKTRKTGRLHAIEELLMQETFTREECSRLILIIQSRVVDGLTTKEAVTERLTQTPWETEEQNFRYTAAMEARRWLSEKKVKSASKSDLDNVIEDGVGSPVDMAKTYMRTRPLWASPTFKQGEFTSPPFIGTQLFQEEAPYSHGGNYLSSSKIKRNTPGTGSWNIQEEIQRVRAKATEEMLSTLPSKRIDWSSFGIDKGANPNPSLTERIYTNVNEKMDKSMEPLDPSFQTIKGRSSSDVIPASRTIKGRNNDNLKRKTSISVLSGLTLQTTPPAEVQNKASLPNEANFTTEKDQNSQNTCIVEGEGLKDGLEHMEFEEARPQTCPDLNNTSLSETGVDAAHEDKQPNNLVEGSRQDPLSHERNCSTLREITDNEKTRSDNGLPPLGNSLSTEEVPGKEAKLGNEEHNSVSSSSNKISADAFEEETCELLTETSVDVSNINSATNEEHHIGNGSQNVSSLNYQSPRYTTRKGPKRGPVSRNVEKQGKRPSRYNRTKQDISTQ